MFRSSFRVLRLCRSAAPVLLPSVPKFIELLHMITTSGKKMYSQASRSEVFQCISFVTVLKALSVTL